MRPGEAAAFEQYCEDLGHKKSTLIARLVREHLEREGYRRQTRTRMAEGS